MDEVHVALDRPGPAAGGVMILSQVLAQHTPAEAGLVPRDFVALGPGLRHTITLDDGKKS